MQAKNKIYKAVVSSDWSECLAPCSPFDCISFNYPQLTSELEAIFKQYTGNIISLGEAAHKIQTLLPATLTTEQMDAYLDNSFSTYKGVPELIEWCLSKDILFMINTTGMTGYFQRVFTTGMTGYFQRVFAKGLLPRVPVLSAHRMVHYPQQDSDPNVIFDLFEIKDKGTNTEAAVRHFNIPFNKIILMGDSGGDGPHFEWGTKADAFLIGSMTKPSLEKYCQKKNININVRFGISDTAGEKKDLQKEMQIDFMDLASLIEGLIL
jgi:2-hydroxy-3-keto-5-methylthiopentenyl-1-phosphate phosphatase